MIIRYSFKTETINHILRKNSEYTQKYPNKAYSTSPKIENQFKTTFPKPIATSQKSHGSSWQCNIPNSSTNTSDWCPRWSFLCAWKQAGPVAQSQIIQKHDINRWKSFQDNPRELLHFPCRSRLASLLSVKAQPYIDLPYSRGTCIFLHTKSQLLPLKR